MCAWQVKYANTTHTVLCTSNGLICGYIADMHFYLYIKEVSHHTSCKSCHNLFSTAGMGNTYAFCDRSMKLGTLLGHVARATWDLS